MYKLIIFDIDGTITRHVSSWQMIHEKLNMWKEFASAYQKKFLDGKISYKRFCELDAKCWKGMPEEKISSIFKPLKYIKNAPTCLRRLKGKGFRLAAVSTGLQYTAETLKKDLCFDFVLSNRLLSRKGILTGAVKINISHGAKGKALKEIFRYFQISPHEAIGVGDSEGDIPLLRGVGYAIAFNSSSQELSSIADYSCKTPDFKEVYSKIREISLKNRKLP
jgi:phosphoserine phosphatase